MPRVVGRHTARAPRGQGHPRGADRPPTDAAHAARKPRAVRRPSEYDRDVTVASGKKTPPDKLAAALEVFARTGNLREAARQTDVPESTLRGAIDRSQLAQARAAHARARDEKIREGCEAVGAGLALTGQILRAEQVNGPGLEAKDIAALMNAVARGTDLLLADRADDDRRRQARLTRERTRLENEVLRARLDGTLPESGSLTATTVNINDPEAVKRRVAELLKSCGLTQQGPAGTTGPAGDPAKAD